MGIDVKGASKMECERCGRIIWGEEFVYARDGNSCLRCYNERKWGQEGSILTDKAKEQIQDLWKHGVSVTVAIPETDDPIIIELEIAICEDESWKLNRLINAIWKRVCK